MGIYDNSDGIYVITHVKEQMGAIVKKKRK